MNTLTTTTPVTRNLNRIFKLQLQALGLRAQAGFVGSFLFVRVDDPEGVLPVKLAWEIMVEAGRMFKDGGLVSDVSADSFGYTMGGVVSNWRRP